jgi:phosphatidylserine/phosphatidylglycerophosphate/cardiolipin synthase-like enzyme
VKARETFLTFVFLLVFLLVLEHVSAKKAPHLGEPAELFSNQVRDDLRSYYLAAIDRAESSILVTTYTMTDFKIIEGLRKKSERGVSVKVICDPEACPKDIDERLGPKVERIYSVEKGLLHRKILIIDGKEVWLGSANLTRDSFRVHGNLVVALNDAELAEEIRLRLEEKRAKKQLFLVGGQDVELWFTPYDREATERLKQLIRSAKKTIKVAMFTFTRRDLAFELIQAYKKGIDVQVVIDGNSGKGAGKAIVNLLEREGVPVFLSQGTQLLHHKMMIVDDDILVNGSANWTLAAFTKNADCFLVISDLNEAQKHKLNRLWNVIELESDKVRKKVR